jgi:hypothetical protein
MIKHKYLFCITLCLVFLIAGNLSYPELAFSDYAYLPAMLWLVSAGFFGVLLSGTIAAIFRRRRET